MLSREQYLDSYQEHIARINNKSKDEIGRDYLVFELLSLYTYELSNLLSRFKHDTPLKLAMNMLFMRNSKLLQSIGNTFLDGYYDAALILLRAVDESILLMCYLLDNGDKASEWLDGKKIRPSTMRNELNFDSKIYTYLSRNHVHPNVGAYTFQIENKTDNSLELQRLPIFNDDKCKTSFFMLMKYLWWNFLNIGWVHKEEIKSDKDWMEKGKNLNVIMMDYFNRKMDG